MNTPKFNNRPNAHVRYYFSDERGLKVQQDFFVGRATAVVGVVFAFTTDGMQILITRRSGTMRDEANKYGVPCGYLDWDESRHEAMIREVYEETSMYLPDYDKYLLFNNDGEPYRIKDKPSEDKRQNISHIYLSVFDFSKEMSAFPLSIEAFTCKETAMVRWMKLETFYATYPEYEWAFNHDETIKGAVIYHNKIFFNNIKRDEIK
jgi:8-oxo-dGTP pyrophosphatase MutT (NUDIX family)